MEARSDALYDLFILKDGETIISIEIEEVLCTHTKVLDVQVVGVPDPQHQSLSPLFITSSLMLNFLATDENAC
jgi:acyl-coenzyme A synthetase/AMP-(fatty) acid ligase